MSWHYSVEQGEDFSVQDYLAGLRSQRSKSRSIQDESSYNDNETRRWTGSPCGTMSLPLTASHGGASSTSSPEASRAKTSARRVKVKDLPEAVVAYGLRCCASLMRSGLAMSSRKTVRTCVPVVSASSSKDLPAWGMTYGGECWELGTRVRLTKESGCGYMLPTPTKSQYGYQINPGGKPRPSLNTMARRNMWPTPTKRDHKDSPGMVAQRKDGKSRLDTLPRVVFRQEQTKIGGQLNPVWVEWLMGWPLGWTDLRPLAMDKSRQWLHSHGKSWEVNDGSA